MQVLEYLRAFLVARVGWSRLNALGIISGAFRLFHRPVLEAVGGYWTQTVGEDFGADASACTATCRETREPAGSRSSRPPSAGPRVPADLATLAASAAAGSAACGRASAGTPP